ncbi:MAG: hypothetical protein V9G98_22495 [Candidatus Competibacter sp.]
MARPHLDHEPVYINIKLGLHPEFDTDLIAWFESIPGRSRAAAVIARLRQGGAMLTELEGEVDTEQIDSLLNLVF